MKKNKLAKIQTQPESEKLPKRRLRPRPKTTNLISGAIYIMLNIVLALMVVGAVDLFDSPWLGLVIIAISKWRIFAVKIRFWRANLASNFTDALVGVSYVFLTSYLGYEHFYYQLGLAGLYLIWLLFIKPGTTEVKVMAQCLIAMFVANQTLSLFAYNWHVGLFLLAEMFIAYNAMGHYLRNSDFESQYTRLMSGIWGLIMMELAWIYWHWTVGYTFLAGVKISQFAIVSTVLTLLAHKVLYFMNQEPGIERRQARLDMVASSIFVVILIIVMIVFFSKPVTTI